MYTKFMDGLKTNPILYFITAITSTALVTFMSSTFATVSHVEKQVKSVKEYVNEKHEPIKEDITEIKASVKNIEATLLKVLLKEKRGD